MAWPHQRAAEVAGPWLPGLGLPLVLLASCVTEQVTPERPTAPIAQAPLVIPLAGTSGDDAVTHYYGDVLRQMRDALTQDELETLERLVQIHAHQGAPAWASGPIRSFERAARGLRFTRDLRARARLVSTGAPLLGAPIDLELQIPQHEDWPVELGGARDPMPASFLLRFKITDHDAFGDRYAREHSEILSLPGRVHLDQTELRLPVRVAIEAGAAVLREIDAEVELLPGQVVSGGEPVPHKRVAVARASWSVYPRNHEPIRKEPLKTLEAALRLGEPQLLGHVYLACRFLPERDHEAAITALVRAVRVGDAGIAKVAGAGLGLLTGEPIAPQDREAWLGWWQRRAR